MPSDACLDDLSLSQLEDDICTYAAHLAAATCRWLHMLAAFDRRNGWQGVGVKSLAHWLAWRCGIDLHTARQYIRVAHALEGLPKIADAFGKGELSYSKVRAVTRIATPQTEEDLLAFARAGTASHVEKLVSGYRRCLPPELADVNEAYRRRYVDWRFDEDGSMVIVAKLPADEGALVVEAIKKVRDDVRKTNRRSPEAMDGRQDGSAEPSLDRADALTELARRELAGARPQASCGDRYQVVVHMDVETVLRGTGTAALEVGAGVATETAKRLLCDCSLVGTVRDPEGNVLDIGRKTRSIPGSLRRALRIRDGCCVFPGCTNARFVDGHHVKHWVHGGATALPNLASLCSFHHRLVHEGGFAMRVEPDGAFTFFTPSGDPVADPGPPVLEGDIEAHNAALGLEFDRLTATAGWRGEKCDYGLATEVLYRKAGVG